MTQSPDALERLREVVNRFLQDDERLTRVSRRLTRAIADPGMVEELARVFDNEAAKRLGLSVTWKQLAEIVLNHLASSALEGEDG